MILYKTTDYSSYCQFVLWIESTAEICRMKDTETVVYAVTELEYSEKELWEVHIKNDSMKKTWRKMTHFLLLHMRDFMNWICNAWWTLFHMRKKKNEDHYQWLHCFQQNTCEIEDEFKNSDKFVKHLFLWKYDRAMQNKLDEQADLLNTLCDIAAVTICLQATLQADKLQDLNKLLWFNAVNTNVNTSSSAKTENNNNRSVKQTLQRNSDSVNSNKSQNMTKQKICCYKCDKKDHKSSDCSDKTE